jgi:integrase
VRPWTYRGYEVVVTNHIVPSLGKVRLSRLTPQDVQALMARLAVEGLAPKSIRNVRTVLSAALTQAERWGMVRRNVARLVQPPRREQHEIQPLTPDEARRFLAAVSGHRLEALFTVALTLGLRQGEALGLTWADVDLEAGVLNVRHQLQRVDGLLQLVALKTVRSRRSIAMPAQIVTSLAEHHERQLAEGRVLLPTAFVFTTPAGGPLEARTVLRWFAGILTGAGIRHIRFHDLRHSAATLMLIQGVPARVVMDVLGHADMSMVTTYQHVVPELQREAAKRIDAFLTGES